jgi:hypothetical protein
MWKSGPARNSINTTTHNRRVPACTIGDITYDEDAGGRWSVLFLGLDGLRAADEFNPNGYVNMKGLKS